MSYDDTVYTVTIRVTNADNGGLQSEIWATTDDDPKAKVREISFLNTYAPPAPATPKPDDHPEIEQAIKDGTWGATPTPTAVPWFVPQTSDAFPLMGLVVILIVAAVAMVVLIVARKRKSKQDE